MDIKSKDKIAIILIIFSFMSPVIAVALVIIVKCFPQISQAYNGYAGLFLAAFIFIGVIIISIFGLISGVISLFVIKRYKILALGGVALNGVIVLSKGRLLISFIERIML